MYGAISGIEAAAETAAKLEATLNVKKKPDLSEQPKAFFKNTDVLKIIQAEYSINHCTQAVRNLLCKGATQEKIREYCEAYVSTKGRYISEGNQSTLPEKGDKAFGLYLFIQGPNKRSVDLAIAMIEGIIATGETRPPALMSLNTAAPPPGSAVAPQPNIQTMPPPTLQNIVQMQVPPPSINLIEKVPIGIDRPFPGFNLPMKLIGQNGSNLQYIRNETGAVVTLRGIGSAFIEPTTGQEAQEVLHFSIEHSKPEGLATARELAVNLIATVQQEYAQVQASQAASVQQVTVDPNLLVHQPPLDQQIMHQPMLATSITLPVVQTGSFLQQPSVAAVPPPQFNHPPPPQLSLPPPGIHIPPQQGPLVPPPGHPPQQLQIQQPGEQVGGMVQQQFQSGPQQQQQQQYLITQSGQPVQGIMTSQGFVVLNQQPQQVFLSQPPGQGPQVIHQGQLAFQSAGPTAVSAPVSYQLQYVQQNQGPTMSGSPIHLHQPQQQQQQHAVVLQQPGQVQFQNGTVHIAQQQVLGVKPGDSNQIQQQIMQPGQIMQVKHIPQTVQVVQPYAPTVQYMSSPGIRPDQTGPIVQKEPRLGKRKFTEEAEPQTSPQQQQQQATQQPLSSPQQSQMQQQTQQPMMQMTQQQQMAQHQLSQQQQINPAQQIQMIHTQQMLQPPPQHPQQFQNQQQMPMTPPQHQSHFQSQQLSGPQPVPHPSQTMATGQQIRQGVGLQDLMSVNQLEREDQAGKGSGEAPAQQGKSEGGEDKTPPPPPGPGNGQYVGQQQPSLDSQHKLQQQNQWYEIDQNQKGRSQQQPPNEYGFNNVYTRRERPMRDRPTFNHYSSKPQMYAYQSYMQPAICPPPPPPPPPMQQQHPQQQQHYYYHRR